MHLDGHQSYTIISKKDAKINITFGFLFWWRVRNCARTVPFFLYLCFFSSRFGFTVTSRFTGELLCFLHFIPSALLRLTLIPNKQWFWINRSVQSVVIAYWLFTVSLYLLKNRSSHCAYKGWHLLLHINVERVNFLIVLISGFILMSSSKLEL